jgi:hypothetical protein
MSCRKMGMYCIVVLFIVNAYAFGKKHVALILQKRCLAIFVERSNKINHDHEPLITIWMKKYNSNILVKSTF